jgi:hypothetical protein
MRLAVAGSGAAIVAFGHEMPNATYPYPSTQKVAMRPPGGEFGALREIADGAWLHLDDVDLSADGRGLLAYRDTQGQSFVQAFHTHLGLLGGTTPLAATRIPMIEISSGGDAVWSDGALVGWGTASGSFAPPRTVDCGPGVAHLVDLTLGGSSNAAVLNYHRGPDDFSSLDDLNTLSRSDQAMPAGDVQCPGQQPPPDPSAPDPPTDSTRPAIAIQAPRSAKLAKSRVLSALVLSATTGRLSYDGRANVGRISAPLKGAGSRTIAAGFAEVALRVPRKIQRALSHSKKRTGKATIELALERNGATATAAAQVRLR